MPHPPAASAAAWQTAPERDFLAFRLITVAELQLDTYFTDPVESKAYCRPRRRAARVLAAWEKDGATLTLTALPAAEKFQVSLGGAGFNAMLELHYLTEETLLQAATVEQFSGDIPAALIAASAWLDEEPDEPEETMLQAALAEIGGGFPAVRAAARDAPADPAPPASPEGPPPASTADTRQVEALVRAAAAELRRHGSPSLDAMNTAWLESQPQTLWPMLDAAVAASNARRRDEELITASRWLLANQLELIRYRLEGGHYWARAMLDTYQEKLIALVQAKTLAETEWFELVNLLNIAKVPIRPEMAEALAAAAAQATPDAPSGGTAQDLSRHLRGHLDELATLAESPFVVVEGLAQTGTLMPAEMRAFMTHELGLSPHSVLREAVPLLLLDPEPAVRQAAAAVLEQVASPETISPVMLRRTLLLRNWVPDAEREAIDRLVRKSRMKGVVCAQWAVAPKLVINSSMIDGSGAQSLLLTTPAGQTGPFIGLLLKQGFGIRDCWCNASLPRAEINRSLRETQRLMTWHATGRDHLDVVVQHHLACGLAAGRLPQVPIVDIAETIGAVDWKDRRLDVAAEIERLFNEVEAKQRGPAALFDSLQRSGVWIAKDPMMRSWFEDDAAVRAVAGERPPLTRDAAVQRLLGEVLTARREVWAERLLLLVLWLQPGPRDAMSARRRQDCVVLAQALLAGHPLQDIPAMVAIAERSIFAARAGKW